jgi:hypothetical protein
MAMTTSTTGPGVSANATRSLAIIGQGWILLVLPPASGRSLLHTVANRRVPSVSAALAICCGSIEAIQLIGRS